MGRSHASSFPSPALSPRLRRAFVPGVTAALLAFLSAPVQAAPEDLRINEFMAANRTTLLDEAGDADDWLEILNTGEIPVNLEGMFLSDEPDDPQMWEFPDTVIAPGEYVIVWCDDEPDEGPLHAGFHLNADGEFIGLYEPLAMGNDVIDSTSFGHQAIDVSYGRYPDGAGSFGYMPTPTPGAENAPFGNVPPFFEDTAHSPLLPEGGEPVAVVSTISDDSQILEAKVFYDPGTGFEEAWLHDDGAHGDSLAGDGIYGGFIPGHPAGSHVAYYIWALDDSSATGTDPPSAPGETFGYEVGYVPPPLFVNEFMAINDATIADEYGEYEDWVEIYNRSCLDFNLGGFHLTDDPEQPDRFVLPDTTLPSGGFLLIWCDDDVEQGPLHANFKLSGAGEFIGLYDRSDHGLIPIDTLSFGPQSADVSYGRTIDGGGVWVFFAQPTPGGSNQGSAAPDWWPAAGKFGILRMPAPVRGRLDVTFRVPPSEAAQLGLFDPTGRCVCSWRVPAESGQQVARLGLDKLPSGVYMLRLEAAGCRSCARVVLLK